MASCTRCSPWPRLPGAIQGVVDRGGRVVASGGQLHSPDPVRAGIQTVETLRGHELSSFPKFFRRRCPACLVSRDWLCLAGNLKPTPGGMRCYHRYLAMAEEGRADRRSALYRDLCRGWSIGTREGRKALVQDFDEGRLGDERSGKAQGYGQERAEVPLDQGLGRLGKSGGDLHKDRKLADWKVVLAGWIKVQCGVGEPVVQRSDADG